MKIVRAYKYQCTIKKVTTKNLDKYFEMCRSIYNACIEQRELYFYRSKHKPKEFRKTISNYEQKRQLVDVKQEWPEYYEIPSSILQDIPFKKIQASYNLFFSLLKKRKEGTGFPGTPRYKRYKDYRYMTITYTGDAKLLNNYFIIKSKGKLFAKFKLLSYFEYPVQGKIKTVTITQNDRGKTFVSFSCETNIPDSSNKHQKKVGLDVGVSKFVYDSDGKCFEGLNILRPKERELRVLQRKVSRRKKGSERRRRAVKEVAILYEKIANTRKTIINQISRYYADNYDVVDLKIANLVLKPKKKKGENRKNVKQKAGLNKSILDSGWGMFFEQLRYKLEEQGKIFLKVPPHYTSQKCSHCGTMVKKALSVRTHKCPNTKCGFVGDRDYNASINILNKGLGLLKLTA